MKNLYKLVVTTLIIFILCSCQASTIQNDADSSKQVIKIAYLPITHSIPLLVQDELEKNSELPYEIELVKFTAWPELVDALRQNKVDGASMLFEVALKAYEDSENLKLISLTHREGNVVVSNKSIMSFKDLQNQIVAIPHKLSPHNTLLHILLEKEGMSIDDIKVIELAPADMPSALVSGAISAFIVAEPYGSISALSDTGKILYNSKEITDLSACCAMIFHNNFLSENQEIASAFIEDFMDAAAIADKKDDFVVKTYGKYMSIKPDVIAASLETTSFNNLALPKEEYDQITDLAIKYKILDFVPEYDDFVYRPQE